MSSLERLLGYFVLLLPLVVVLSVIIHSAVLLIYEVYLWWYVF